MPSAICLAILIRACWKKRKKRGYREAKKRSLSGEGTRGESAQFRKASEAKKKEEEERNRKGKKSERLNKLTSPTWIAAAKTPASGSRASGEEEGGSCCCCWCVEVEVEVEERRRGYEKQASTGPSENATWNLLLCLFVSRRENPSHFLFPGAPSTHSHSYLVAVHRRREETSRRSCGRGGNDALLPRIISERS